MTLKIFKPKVRRISVVLSENSGKNSQAGLLVIKLNNNKLAFHPEFVSRNNYILTLISPKDASELRKIVHFPVIAQLTYSTFLHDSRMN